jgi:hypothetical protein
MGAGAIRLAVSVRKTWLVREADGEAAISVYHGCLYVPPDKCREESWPTHDIDVFSSYDHNDPGTVRLLV